LIGTETLSVVLAATRRGELRRVKCFVVGGRKEDILREEREARYLPGRPNTVEFQVT